MAVKRDEWMNSWGSCVCVCGTWWQMFWIWIWICVLQEPRLSSHCGTRVLVSSPAEGKSSLSFSSSSEFTSLILPFSLVADVLRAASYTYIHTYIHICVWMILADSPSWVCLLWGDLKEPRVSRSHGLSSCCDHRINKATDASQHQTPEGPGRYIRYSRVLKVEAQTGQMGTNSKQSDAWEWREETEQLSLRWGGGWGGTADGWVEGCYETERKQRKTNLKPSTNEPRLSLLPSQCLYRL